MTTLVLDADGVVQSVPSGWISRIEAFLEPNADRQAFIDELFAAERPCIVGKSDFATVLEDLLKRWGSSTDIAEALSVWEDIVPATEILDCVAGIRAKGITVCLATNQQAYRYRHMSQGLDYDRRFDRILVSCELGVAKPSEAFFDRVMGDLRARSGEVLFLDDKADCVRAARRCGMLAERFELSEGRQRFEALLAQYGMAAAQS